MDLELEALFREALQASPPNASEILRNLRSLYTDPKNWYRSHGVELTWHGECQGVFSEYLHVSGARKLVKDPTAEAITRESM